jgi:hypothetical protein
LLFSQIGQVFFDSLHLKFEFRQIGFQFFYLFSLGLEAALKVTPATAAFAVTLTIVPTFAGFILAITGFILGHFISPYNLFCFLYYRLTQGSARFFVDIATLILIAYTFTTLPHSVLESPKAEAAALHNSPLNTHSLWLHLRRTAAARTVTAPCSPQNTTELPPYFEDIVSELYEW